MTESEFATFKKRVDEDRTFLYNAVMPWRVTHTHDVSGAPICARRDGAINGASVNVESYYVVISVVAKNAKSTIMLPASTPIEDAMAFADDILKRYGVVFIEPDAVATASPDAVPDAAPGDNVTQPGCCITPTDK